MLIAILGDSVADDDAGIANRSRDREHFEIGLGKIAAERVEIVHFVADIKECVFGIISGHGRPDDHAGGVHAVADNAGGGGGVTAECSEIGNSESELALSLCEPYDTEEYCSKADFVSCFHRQWSALK